MKVNISSIRLSEQYQQVDLEVLNNFLNNVTVVKTASELINGKFNMWSVLVFYEEKSLSKASVHSNTDLQKDSELSEHEEEQFALLKKWRIEKSIELSIPAYMICHNKDLISIIKMKPTKLQDLQNIRGFGDKKIESYGAEILEIIK